MFKKLCYLFIIVGVSFGAAAQKRIYVNEYLNIGDVRKAKYHAFETDANNTVLTQ